MINEELEQWKKKELANMSPKTRAFMEKQLAENKARMEREAKGIYPPAIYIVP